MKGTLIKTLPQHTTRYEVHSKVERTHITVHPMMITDDAPKYLPHGWIHTVHPEGNLYFYLEHHNGLTAVTECNMHHAKTADCVIGWTQHILILALDKKMVLPENTELCVRLDGDNCGYYFVDHTAHTVFWLEAAESNDLGLLPVATRSHMVPQLEAQYWNHREYFCNHKALDIDSVVKLELVLQHALNDVLTSSQSTFPYEEAKIKSFLGILIGSRSSLHEGYTVAFVSRLWAIIMNNRYETHYGQDQARLSRDCSILLSQPECKWTKYTIYALTLGMAAPYNRRLNSLFVDETVYGDAWTAFIKQCLESWRVSALGSTVLIFSHIFSILIPVPNSLAYTSVIIAAVSVLVAVFLLHRHGELADGGADEGHEYLSNIKLPYLKFQHTAAVFALPKVLAFLSSLLILAQWSVVLAQHAGAREVAGIAVAVGIVFAIVVLSTSSGREMFRGTGPSIDPFPKSMV